jgi:hypothetical protein
MKKHLDPALAAARALALALAGALPLAAQAQSAADDWKFGATIYGWFPAIGGSTSFPSFGGGGGAGGGAGSNISVSSQQVIDALNFAFMGTFEGRKGQWGFWTDLVYADFGATKSAFRDFDVGEVGLPVGVSADLGLDVKSWIWTAAGSYRLVSTPEYSSDLLAGARLMDMRQTLGWTFNGDIAGLPLPGRTGAAEVRLNNWDAVVGVKGRASFGADRRWYVPYYLDVGAGQSKLTWQAIGGLGYEFNWGSVLATWRYLSYDLKSGSPIQSLYLSGPTLGVSFRW